MDNNEKEYWEEKNYSLFQNKKCEFFPCHQTPDAENFNCLFCYCPLYALGTRCGGNYKILKNGVKDCSKCSLPHARKSFGYVTGRFQDIIDLVKKDLPEGSYEQ